MTCSNDKIGISEELCQEESGVIRSHPQKVFHVVVERQITPSMRLKVNGFILTLICSIAIGGCIDPATTETTEGEVSSAGRPYAPMESYVPPINMGGVSGDMNPSERPRSCTPGERLGVCLECAPDQTTRVPRQDPECPAIDCSGLISYELNNNDQGDLECHRITHEPGASICQGEGACYHDPELYCTERPPEVVMNSRDLDECEELSGCRDQIEPTTTYTPGVSCQSGEGTCNEEGVCEAIPLTCLNAVNLDYNPNNILCEDQLNALGYCEYLVYATNNPWNQGGGVTCHDFCSGKRGQCLNAWSSENNTCRRRRRRGCNEPLTTIICSCSPF